MSRIPALIAASLIIGPGLAGAQEPTTETNGSPDTLSLARAYEIAREDNPALRAARLAPDAARGEKLQAEALPDPILVWDFDEADGLSPGGFGEQKIGLVQHLEFPGKRGLRGDMGEDQIEIERRRADVLEVMVLREVAAAYWRLARIESSLELLAESRELLRQFAEITRSRYETNQAPYADVVRAELELARLENELIALARDRRSERIRLALELGRDSDASLETADSLAYEPLEVPFETVLARRISESRTLAAARLRRDQAQKGVRLAGKSNLPDFEIGAFYQRLNEAGDGANGFFAAELSLSLPLWRTRQRGEALAADARQRASVVALAGLETRVEGDVRAAWEELRRAAEQVEVFETRLLGEAEDALQTAISAYQYGQIDALDLIDLYRTAKEVRLEYLTALEHHRVARERLDLSGEILTFD